MTQKKTKTINGKHYKRFGGYSTKKKAELKAEKLRNGYHEGVYLRYFKSVRIIKNDNLNKGKYVIWVHGKSGDRKVKYR